MNDPVRMNRIVVLIEATTIISLCGQMFLSDKCERGLTCCLMPKHCTVSFNFAEKTPYDISIHPLDLFYLWYMKHFAIMESNRIAFELEKSTRKFRPDFRTNYHWKFPIEIIATFLFYLDYLDVIFTSNLITFSCKYESVICRGAQNSLWE